MTDGYRQCQAGSRADMGGRWKVPCLNHARNTLAFSEGFGLPMAPGSPLLHFCDDHTQELIDAGLIEEPNVGEEEFERRKRAAAEPETIVTFDDGFQVGLQAVNVNVTDSPTEPGYFYDTDTGELLDYVDEWVTLECVGCKRRGRIAKPPDHKAPRPDGIYVGYCPTCAKGAGIDGPLNRAERRRKRKNN